MFFLFVNHQHNSLVRIELNLISLNHILNSNEIDLIFLNNILNWVCKSRKKISLKLKSGHLNFSVKINYQPNRKIFPNVNKKSWIKLEMVRNCAPTSLSISSRNGRAGPSLKSILWATPAFWIIGNPNS